MGWRILFVSIARSSILVFDTISFDKLALSIARAFRQPFYFQSENSRPDFLAQLYLGSDDWALGVVPDLPQAPVAFHMARVGNLRRRVTGHLALHQRGHDECVAVLAANPRDPGRGRGRRVCAGRDTRDDNTG